ncbi:hypothetical protein EDB81DRAFT_948268 [Dactylonectria macrodidyma]|uniref:Mfs allantoate protein n=1 Tax=Dactylonectria macrodidyma TaxID=307937 RepID=A0A9P9ER29_9HYPO|nr:hypothetical protein EDB81DRAFT_948268 [Dactylonectria macrodidyma]
MASVEGQCQALQLSDGERCTNEATNANLLFCKFHAKQVYGLYKGYKRRNARLDAIDDEAPSLLKNSEIPLANETFEKIEDVEVLREIHVYLFDKYVLIGKVIDARKLHHKHFYSLNIDYGHQSYLDKLSSQRHIILLALGRLEKHTAQVLYQKEQWFSWVRKIQDEEEARSEKEQKKVKLEAALFKRHWKQLQARLQQKREKEEKKRQDAYLEDAFQERMAMSAEESEDDETWDPIEDMARDDRDRYIDLIKHFLWMGGLEAEEDSPTTSLGGKTEGLALGEESQPPKKAKKRPKAKGGIANKKTGGSNSGSSNSRDAKGNDHGQQRLLAMQQEDEDSAASDLPEPDKGNIETEEEMRKRLKEGVKKNYNDAAGWHLVGTLENPHETYAKTAPMTDDEIESVVRDVREIKVLLFCRLLLVQASLLPAALRAPSMPEFLRDPGIVESDLRDLCLKVEKPSLQEIRDACADFARGDDVDDDEEEEEEEDYEGESFEDLLLEDRRYSHLHSQDWLFENVMRQVAGKKSRKKKKKRKTKVTICGKSIWNHSSERAMSRDGWLQFSIIAKDCDLKHAIQLCRNWNEFSDLNLLTHWQYFPASNWVAWGGNRLTQQLQDLELFPYFMDLEAQQHNRHNQVGGRATRARRQHDFVEARNVMAVHMKRSDPVTRRFLQYLMMRPGETLVLVRDGKTGRVITAPPEEHLWTYRIKQGLGRASKSEWLNILEVGPQFFKLTDKLREWRFGFDNYYDIFIWDFVPGEPGMNLYNVVVSELRNAWRITQPRDVYAHMKPLLQTLTRESDTMRTRQIKPGEVVKSLWETVTDERNEFRLFDIKDRNVMDRSHSDLSQSPYMFYNEANAAEDEVLFPDELASSDANVPFREIRNGISRIERSLMPSSMKTIAKGLEELTRGDGPLKALGSINGNGEAGPWALPNIFKTGLKQLLKEDISPSQRMLLTSVSLGAMPKKPKLSDMEEMERDRAIGFKESFHAGDLEPGGTPNFREVQDKITLMLNYGHSGPTDWVWFLVDTLKWLGLQARYDTYIQDPAAPWPHSYIVQDLVRAFACMAMFFPELEVTALVTKFIQSTQCEGLRNSLLFDPKERRKTRPDRRGRTSYKFRDKAFWAAWNKFMQGPRYYADDYPMDWSLAIRPIIAHLYREGVIGPAYLQNDSQVVAGMATANTEPHRPGKLDLFINYEDKYGNFPMEIPSYLTPPDKWPELLPKAQSFAAKHPTARFGLLRLWSAPHYYPFMVGLHNRQSMSFLDSAGRAWEWKFVPKDMPGSEYSAHRVTESRLEILQAQFKDNVVNRGDLILVMGADSQELFKYCTAVTFAMQTKPWLREIDLWKSFINVDLDFLIDLDSHWLD